MPFREFPCCPWELFIIRPASDARLDLRVDIEHADREEDIELNAAAGGHKTHLGSAQHSISFKVEFAKDGQVDSVVLKDSTLGDEGLEACLTPESRAFLGQEQALLCLA